MKRMIFICLILFMCVTTNSYSGERFVIPLDKANYLDTSMKTYIVGSAKVNVSLDRQVRSMRPFKIKLKFDQAVTDIILKFNMSMDMGRYVYNLEQENGEYIGNIVLPKCIFGGKVWFVKLEFKQGENDYSKVFFFDVN